MLKQPYQPFEWIEMDKNGQVVKIQNLFSLEGVKFKNKPPEPPRRTPEQVAQDIEIINQPRKSLEEEYKEIQQKKWRNQPYYENKNKGRNQPYYENKNKGRNQPYYENKNKGRNQPYYENKNKGRNQPYYENKNKGRNQPYYENKNKGRNQPYYENKNKGRNQPYYENKNKGRNQPYYENKNWRNKNSDRSTFSNKNWRRNNYKGNKRYPFFSRWKRPFSRPKPQVWIGKILWKKLNNDFKPFDALAVATTMFQSEVRRRVKVSSPYKRFYLKKNGLTLLSSKLVFSWSRSVFQKLIFIFLLELLNIGQKTYTRKFLFLQIIKAETLLGYYNRIQFHSLNIGGIDTDSIKQYSVYQLKRNKKRLLKHKVNRKNSIGKKKKLFKVKLIPHVNRRFHTKKKRYWWGNPGSRRYWVKGQSLKRLILGNPHLGKMSKLIKFLNGDQQVFLTQVAVGAFVYSCNKRHWKWKATPGFLAWKDWKKITRYDFRTKKVAMQTISSFFKSRALVLKIKRRRSGRTNRWLKNKKRTTLLTTGLKQGKRVVRKIKAKVKKNQGSKKIKTKLQKWIKKRVKKVVKKRKNKARKIRSILWDKRRGSKYTLYFQDNRYVFQKAAYKVRDHLAGLRTLKAEAAAKREKRKAYAKWIFLRGIPLKINVVRKKFHSIRKETFLFQSRKGKFKSLYKTSRFFKPKKLNVWWIAGLEQDVTPYFVHERKLRKFFFRRYSGRKMWLRQKRWVLTRITRLRPKIISVLSGENRLRTSNFSISGIKKIAALIKTSLLRYVFLFWLTFLALREYKGAAYFYKPFVIKQTEGSILNYSVPRILNNFSDIVQENNVFLIPALSRLGEIYKNNFLEREELGVKSKRLKYIEAHGVQKKRQYKFTGFGKVGGLQNTTESILKYFWFIAFKYRKKQKTPGVPKQLWFFNAVERQLKKKTQRQLHLFFPKSESKRALAEKMSRVQYQRNADNFLVASGQFEERLNFYQTILSRRIRVYWRRRALAKLLSYVKLSSEIKPGKKKTLNGVLLGREKGGLCFQKLEPRFNNRKTSAFCNRVNVKFKAITEYLDSSSPYGQKENSLSPILVGAKKFKTWASVPIIKIFWLLLLSQYLFKNWQKIFIKYFSLKQKKTTQIPVPGRIILNGFRGKGWRKNRLLYRQARPFWFYLGFQNFNSDSQKKRNWRNRNYNKKERAHDLYIKQLTNEQYFMKIFQPWAIDTRFFINTRQLKTNFFLSLFNNLKRKKIFDVNVSSNVKSTVQFKRKGWKKNKIDRSYLKPVVREKGVADPLFYVRKYIKVLKKLSGFSFNIKKRPMLFQTLVLSVLCKCIVSRQLLKNMSNIQKGKGSKKNVKKKKTGRLLLKLVRGWKKKKNLYLLYRKRERRGQKFKNADAEKNNKNIRHWWYICRYIYTQYAYWYLSQEKPLDKVAWTVSKFRRNVSGLFRNYPTRIRAILPPLSLMRNKYAGEEVGFMDDIVLADEVDSEKVKRYLIKRARTYLRYSAVPFDNLFIFRRKRRSLIKIRYLFKQLFLWIYQQKSTRFKLGAEIRRSLFKNFFFKNIFVFRKNVRRF